MDSSLKTYTSEVDRSMYFLVMGIVLISIAPIFFMDLSLVLLIILITCLASAGLVHMVFYGIKYIVNFEEKTLLIKVGFITHGKYDIMKIRSVKKSNTWLSSPAASMDRIELKIKYSQVVISPSDRLQFIDDLLSIQPDIMVEQTLLNCN